MRIKRDVFAVASGVRAADGTKAEPEQQPTRTLIETSMPINTPQGAASMPMLLTHDAPAGEAAQALSARCISCKWFRRRAWAQLVEECDFPTAPLMKRQAINEVRSALLLTKNASITEPGEDKDGDFDVEHVMRTHMGLCEALSNVRKDYVVVHMTGCCPDDVKSPSQPVGYFTPRNSDVKKAIDAHRDEVLNKAAGKIQ